MRFFKLLFFVVISISLLLLGKASAEAAFNPYRPLCVGIQGKFVVKNWKGGPIQVGCVGDDGGATSNANQRCTGEVQTVKPGKEFRLTKCSCWGAKGCLKIGKELKLNPLNNNNRRTITVVKKIKDVAAFKNNNCTVNDVSKVCAANGAKIKGNVKITCRVPITGTITPTETPTPTITGTITPTVSPTPPMCPVPEVVTNVRVSCPNCFSAQEPTPTPVQQVLACGASQKPILQLIGLSEKSIPADTSDASTSFDLKFINCSNSSPANLTLDSDFLVNSDGWTMDANNYFSNLQKGDVKQVTATIKSSFLGGKPAGTKKVVEFFVYDDISMPSNKVTVTVNVN